MTSTELHRSAVVVDTHNDLLMAVVARPPARWSNFFRERWLPQLQTGGVRVQVLPVWVDATDDPEAALRQMLRMIEAAHRIAEGNRDRVTLCRDVVEVDDTLAAGRIALILAIEGCAGVGQQVELLGTMYRLGVRITSLTHFGRTALADGSGEDAAGSRLTRAGVAAVRFMNETGMLVDVSHLGVAGVEHVLELSTRPVLATHSSARVLCDHHRNLADSQLRAIAAGGGVICVNFFAGFVHADEHTLDRLLDHFAHLVSVAGVDHVGMGPDFLAEIEHELTPPWCDDLVDAEGIDPRACIPGLEGPAGLPSITAGLLQRGFEADDVRKILGGNVMRVFRDELVAPSQRT